MSLNWMNLSSTFQVNWAADGSVIDMATMFGFMKNQHGTVAIANRIFETRLYNFYLSEDEMQGADIDIRGKKIIEAVVQSKFIFQKPLQLT